MSKPAFDPSKPYEPVAAEKPAFDPGKPYEAVDLGSNPAPKMSGGEAFVHGAAQGATLGFADEATAALGATRDVAQAALGLRGDIGWKDAYESYIDKVRAKTVDKPMADQKAAFIGGNIAGTAALAIPGAVGGLAGRGAATAAKELGLGAKLLRGAGLGGVTGAGTSEANLTKTGENGQWQPNLGQLGRDVTIGAATGAAAEGIGHFIGKAAKSVTPTELRKTSNIQASKAAGALGSDLKKLGPERTQLMGEEIQKAGLKAFDNVETIGQKISAAKEDAGQAIGDALDSVDDLVAKSKAAVDAGNMPAQAKENLKAAIDKNFQFNLDRIGQRIEKEVIEPNLIRNKAGELAPTPTLRNEIAKLQELSTNFKEFGAVSMRQGNLVKSGQGRVTNFNSETVPQTFKKEVYDIIKTELDDIVGKTGNLEQGVAKMSGSALGEAGDVAARNKSVLGDYVKAKKTYSGLSSAEEINQARQGSLAGNRSISLTDTIAGVGGLASGGAVPAIALGAANKAIRTFGSSVGAVGARKAADLMEKSPKALGAFYPLLKEAADNGVAALAATHSALLKDPNYLRILESDQRDQKSEAIKRRIQGGN